MKGRHITIYGEVIEPKSLIHNHKKYYLAEAFLTKKRAEDDIAFTTKYKQYHTVIKESKSFKPAWCIYIRKKEV
jgi:hypothetical protein